MALEVTEGIPLVFFSTQYPRPAFVYWTHPVPCKLHPIPTLKGDMEGLVWLQLGERSCDKPSHLELLAFTGELLLGLSGHSATAV